VDVSTGFQFLKQKSKDQLAQVLELLMQKEDLGSDDGNSVNNLAKNLGNMSMNAEKSKIGQITSCKEARSTLLLLMDMIFYSKNHLHSSESKRLEDMEHLQVDQLKSKLLVRNAFSDNILYCLLYLDGLIMFNIDIVKQLDKLSPLIGINFYDVLFEILSNKFLEDSIKEVASHILSAELSFVNPETIATSYWKELINWTYNYCTLK
jgi:hypothetical protein